MVQQPVGAQQLASPSVVTMLMTSMVFPDFPSLYKFVVSTQFPTVPLTLSEYNLGSLQIVSRY